MKESYKVKTSHPLWPRVMRGRGQLRREAFTGVQPGCVLNSENNNRAGHRAGIETESRRATGSSQIARVVGYVIRPDARTLAVTGPPLKTLISKHACSAAPVHRLVLS